MRDVFGRLILLLVFWYSFLSLFIGRTKGQWLWTLGLVAAFFFAEGVARLILWAYLRWMPDSKASSLSILKNGERQ